MVLDLHDHLHHEHPDGDAGVPHPPQPTVAVAAKSSRRGQGQHAIRVPRQHRRRFRKLGAECAPCVCRIEHCRRHAKNWCHCECRAWHQSSSSIRILQPFRLRGELRTHPVPAMFRPTIRPFLRDYSAGDDGLVWRFQRLHVHLHDVRFHHHRRAGRSSWTQVPVDGMLHRDEHIFDGAVHVLLECLDGRQRLFRIVAPARRSQHRGPHRHVPVHRRIPAGIRSHHMDDRQRDPHLLGNRTQRPIQLRSELFGAIYVPNVAQYLRLVQRLWTVRHRDGNLHGVHPLQGARNERIVVGRNCDAAAAAEQYQRRKIQ
mmetsp:Transcript_28209/g.79192  ORF Transcript_28209/g.79192 Transcript_28209/m.79192 type:complete len:315 (-) Transcript_28209:241-1185(-)